MPGRAEHWGELIWTFLLDLHVVSSSKRMAVMVPKSDGQNQKLVIHVRKSLSDKVK